MIIDFKSMQETCIPEFKGGIGDTIAKMHVDELGKIMYGKLTPGSSIGLHKHETNSEIIYILSGNAKTIYDDTEESLEAGDCHYCPRDIHTVLLTPEKKTLYFLQ